MALDTDYTSTGYNAYSDIVTMDSAIAGIAITMPSDGGWSTLNDTDKELHIINATKFADTIKWYGSKNIDIVVPQRTQPRSGLYYADGTPLDETIIAPEVIDMMACSIIGTLIAIANENNKAPIKKQKVGDVEIEFAKSDASGDYITNVEKCPAQYLLPNWFNNTLVLGGFGTVGLSRLP